MKRLAFVVLLLGLVSAFAGIKLPPVIAAEPSPDPCTFWVTGNRTVTHWQVEAESRSGSQFTEDLTTLEVTTEAYQVDSYYTSEVEVGSPNITVLTSTACQTYVDVYESYGATCELVSSVDVNETTGYSWTGFNDPVPYGPVTVDIDPLVGGDPNLHIWLEYSGVQNTASADKTTTVGTQQTLQCTMPPDVEIPPGEEPEVPDPDPQPTPTEEPPFVGSTVELSDPVSPEQAGQVLFNQPDPDLVFQAGILAEISDDAWAAFLAANGDPGALTNGGLTILYTVEGGFGAQGFFNAPLPGEIVSITRYAIIAASSSEDGAQTIVAIFEEQVLADGGSRTVWYYNTGAAASH